MTGKPKIGIIVGTTRPGRFADKPTQWLVDIASRRDDAEFEVVDLRDYPLPFFEEQMSPFYAPPSNEVAVRWGEKLQSLDGYIFVAGEYNHSVPGVLKNAIDYAYGQYNRKPASFVGYGANGGVRAVEHLRAIMAEMQVAALRFAVHIGLAELMGIMREGKAMTDYPYLEDTAKLMLDDHVWWAKALKAAREA